MSLVPYSIPLSAAAGDWLYTPLRDTRAANGWNASYTGSKDWPSHDSQDTRGLGSLYFRTQHSGSGITLEFVGTGLLICLRETDASFTFSVDNQVIDLTPQSNNDQCRDLGGTAAFETSELAFVRHVASINVQTASAGNEFQFFGGVVRTLVEVADTMSDVTERLVDDKDPQWIARPGRGSNQWDTHDDSLSYQGSNSFTCAYHPDWNMTISFKGVSAFVLYGNPYRDSRDYSIAFDGRMIDLDLSVSGWAVGPTPIFFTAGLLTDREYVLTYRSWAESTPPCDDRDCCATLDYIKLLGSESGIANAFSGPPTSPGSLSTSSGPSTTGNQQEGQTNQSETKSTSNGPNVGAIAGGVVGGAVLGIAIVLAFVFMLWRRRQQQQHYKGVRSMGEAFSPVSPASAFPDLAASPYRDSTIHPFGPESIYTQSTAPMIPTPAPQTEKGRLREAFARSDASGPSSDHSSNEQSGPSKQSQPAQPWPREPDGLPAYQQ